MGYAEVAVNSPAAQRRTFSYSVPVGLDVRPGQAVWVPFGSRLLEGIVTELTAVPAVEETRDIASLVDPEPVLSAAQLAVARWISDYYLSPVFSALALFLPPGFERRTLTFVAPAPLPADFDPSSLTPDQQRALELLGHGRLPMRKVEAELGKARAQATVSHLANRGLALRTYQIEPAKAKAKTELRVAGAAGAAESSVRAGSKPAALLGFLARQSGPVPWSEARKETGADRTALNALVKKGLVTLAEVALTRDPLAGRQPPPSLPLALTPAQQAAFDAIAASLGKPAVFLLHGVTGSGKTEVYLQALAEARRRGQRGIVLVPEIALTPQTIDRFAARFPGKVAVLHSQLTLGEQFDEWRRIRSGEFDVVIGARSALFAPQPDLGLIVIDEEHEWTYKQADTAPRYRARDVAVKLAETLGATVVLGSATPDVETYFRALSGEYRLLELPERVTPVVNAPLPKVQIVDMREELKAGNRELFSRALSDAMAQAVSAGEQVILFLNRRGSATFVQCRQCGLVMRCRRCDIALTYHAASSSLVCHQCNYRMRAPDLCPRCHSARIKFLGAGTEHVEDEVYRWLPQARRLRWDSDAASSRDAHREILEKFRERQADVLIGTQMVAKGLDLPGVTVVGVVNADIGLNLPDFRAGERTFQLLSQVAGRAGRGPRGGRVIMQTYSPGHYAVQAAAAHDYRLFYDKEIVYRRQLGYPPFAQLASLVFTHANQERCRSEAERMKRALLSDITAKGIAGLTMIGPAPAYAHRLRGRFRWQLVLRGRDLSAFLADVPLPRGWTVDIDPVGLA